jgi:hypothetical protein
MALNNNTRLTTQLLDSTMKEAVYPEIEEHFTQKRMLYNWMFKGDGEHINSLGCKLPGYFTPPAGNGFISEGAKGVTPTAAEHAAMRLRYTRFRHAIEYTYDALRAMQNAGENGLAIGLNKDMANHNIAAEKQMNRLAYGTGDGRMGVLTASSGATLTFAKTTALGWTLGSKFIQKYATYDIIDITQSPPVLRDTRQCIAQPDYVNGTAVFDSNIAAQVATDIAAGDVVIVCKQGDYNKAFRGLEFHIAATARNYQTLDTTTYRDLRATTVNGNSNPISVAIFKRMEQELLHRCDGDEGEVIYLSNTQQSESYMLLGYSAKRWEGDADNFDGSFKTISYGDKKWVEDIDCPKDTIYRLAKDAIKKFEFRPWGPIDEGEGMWKSPSGFDTTTGIGAHFERVRGNLGIDAEFGGIHPAALAKINNLDFSNLSTGEY